MPTHIMPTITFNPEAGGDDLFPQVLKDLCDTGWYVKVTSVAPALAGGTRIFYGNLSSVTWSPDKPSPVLNLVGDLPQLKIVARIPVDTITNVEVQ